MNDFNGVGEANVRGRPGFSVSGLVIAIVAAGVAGSFFLGHTASGCAL